MTQAHLTSLILLMLTMASAWTEVADACFEKMPFGCFVTRSEVVPKEQVDAIGKKLGTPIRKLSNTHLQVQGMPIQVNILEVKSLKDAKKLHATVSAMKNHPAFCLIDGTKVIEFCNAEVATATKTAYELGFSPKPKRVQYDLTAHLATIDKADYMTFNALFNVFLQTNPQNPGKEAEGKIRTLCRDFTFGTSVVLRKQSNALYEFGSKPIEILEQPHDRISYSFKPISTLLTIPYVTLKARIVCDDTGLMATDRTADTSLLSATPYWPVDDPQIQALAQNIVSGQHTAEAKVKAILEWLTPGKNIQSDGPAGSRWGVMKVLQQRYGRCWDSSDCFVTLARAVSVPTRQVGGWLYGTSGHIWSEVLIEGKGWQQVDPTGGGALDCGIYHIPYFVTETGEMPILYLSMPQVEMSETK